MRQELLKGVINFVLIKQEFSKELRPLCKTALFLLEGCYSLFWLAIFQTQFWTPINSLLPLISQMFFNFSRHFDPPPSSWFHVNLLYHHHRWLNPSVAIIRMSSLDVGVDTRPSIHHVS